MRGPPAVLARALSGSDRTTLTTPLPSSKDHDLGRRHDRDVRIARQHPHDLPAIRSRVSKLGAVGHKFSGGSHLPVTIFFDVAIVQRSDDLRGSEACSSL